MIADEVYDHLVFGTNPFVPMGVFGSIVPVVTVGSISKRWIVPGWRLGWLVTSDPKGILKKTGVRLSLSLSQLFCLSISSVYKINRPLFCFFQIVDSIIRYRNVSPDPITFMQVIT